MWARLKATHAEKSDQSVQVILEQFITSNMGTGVKVADYIAEIQSLAQRLSDMNMKQPDAVIIAKIISSLPSRYDGARTAWHAVPKAEQSTEKLTEFLVNEESMLNRRETENATTTTENALFAKGRGRGRGFVSSGNTNKFDTQNKKGICNYCKKSGHWARDCMALKPGIRRKVIHLGDLINLKIMVMRIGKIMDM